MKVCVQGQVCSFFLGWWQFFRKWLTTQRTFPCTWTCAFLRHDLPLHLVTCGGDTSHMTVQIKAASHHKTSMFSFGLCDFGDQPDIPDILSRLSWKTSTWHLPDHLTAVIVISLVKRFGKMLLSSRSKQPNRWRICVPTIGCAKLRSAFKKTHPPTSPFVFQESRALNKPPIKVIPSTWNQVARFSTLPS